LKLIVDKNILIASLIRNSTTRFLLLNPNHDFYVPEYAIDEVNKHMDFVSKSGLERRQIELVFDIILENIEIIPMSEMQPNWKKAAESLQSDEKDVPFLALALTIPCDGI
jgi:predicted nucleic acid-binding protein